MPWREVDCGAGQRSRCVFRDPSRTDQAPGATDSCRLPRLVRHVRRTITTAPKWSSSRGALQLDRAKRRHLAALGPLATAQRLLPAAKGRTGLAVAERAAGQPGVSIEGKAIGAVADGDDRLGRDEQAREPEGLVMFGGDGGDASPATKAHRGRGRRSGTAS
jgi:hypothetical protein